MPLQLHCLAARNFCAAFPHHGTVCVAKAWVCSTMGTLTTMPWQDVLVPGQVVELVSCLELSLKKDPIPSQLQESPRPGSRWQKLLKIRFLTPLLGWVRGLLRLWLVRAEARCQLPVSQDRVSQLGLSGEEPGLAVLGFLWQRQPGAEQPRRPRRRGKCCNTFPA